MRHRLPSPIPPIDPVPLSVVEVAKGLYALYLETLMVTPVGRSEDRFEDHWAY